MRAAMLLAILLALQALSLEGDLRTRLWRRFPACRGTIESAYAGDEMSFLHRVRFASGAWGFTLILDKVRGEEWVDLVAGGIRFTPASAWAGPVSLGWLEADLGSGLVLSHPGSAVGSSELGAYKPPVIREVVRTASSPGDCRGDPLTGAGFSLTAAGWNVTLLSGISWRDSTGDGHHRTASEIASRGTLLETLGALRISKGDWGATAAAGACGRGGDGPVWGRAGIDWDLPLRRFRLTGEVAGGADSAGASVAGWTALSLEADRYRQTLTAASLPEGFPGERCSPPVSGEGTGLTYGIRWTLLPRLTLTGGTGAWRTEEGGVFRASVETALRFACSMESALGFRVSRQEVSSDWRGWLTCTWQPADGTDLGMKIQLTGAVPDPGEPVAHGSGLGLTLTWEPAPRLSARLVGAGFSTDDYATRIYAAEPVFPGEFGSTALWGRGFLLGSALSVELDGGVFLRARISRLAREDAGSLGSGWEETPGGARTEAGIQLDWSFP